MKSTKMSEQVAPVLSKLKDFSGVGSLVLAVSIAFSGWVGHSAVNNQQIQNNSKTIETLQSQVRGLQIEIEQNKVVEQELKDMHEQATQTQTTVNRLADEFHAWQREERAFHRIK